MVYDCGACLAKYVLCLLNFGFFLIGSIVLGVGVWIAVEKESFISLLRVVPKEYVAEFTQPAVIQQASYLLIAAGAFMFLVSFLGYCGALRESPCLLTTYGICLLIILILEVTAGGLAAAYKTRAEEETRGFLKHTLSKYYAGGNKTDAVTVMWNHLQAQLHCCGVDDYSDFKNTAWATESSKTIPESCCVLEDSLHFKSKSPTCVNSPNEANSYYKKGCYKAVMTWVMSNINIIIVVAIGLAVLELVCIFLAFCLSKTITAYMKY